LKVWLVTAVKMGGLLSIGAALQAASPLGLPLGTSWFDGFMWGVGTLSLLGAIVSALEEPTEESGKLYVFVFRFGHVLMHRATVYFTHRSFWRMFVKVRDGKEDLR
jgi:hypothetical protein